jgi:hypothetical protein
MERYYLCDLENSEGNKKTAYVKLENAKVGNSFKLKEDKWTIKSVGIHSVSREILEKMNRVEKIGYTK